jgi:hypothetical protein
MWEATVLRTPHFLEAISWITKDEDDMALMRLTSLREQYANDPYSEVEIDRWIARALAKTGRNEEAYALLRQLRPRLEEFQFDLSQHHFQVMQLQQRLGKVDEFQNYCKNVSGYFRTNDALGHLDWLFQYASSSEAAQPTDFMYTVLAVCTIQLGLVVPPRRIAGRDFCAIVERCIELRSGKW